MESSQSRFIGALLIVAGTTIGAGMLALPMTSIQIGYINSCWMLVGMWALMTFTALVTLEIALKSSTADGTYGISIVGLAKASFGRLGQFIAASSLFILFYALLAAYITGSSSILNDIINYTFGINFSIYLSAFLYTVILGACINSCVRMVDYANRFFFMLKTFVFVGMIGVLIPYVKLDHLTHQHSEFSALSLAIPIFFTSFGFHGSIPTLVNYVGPHPKQLRLIILLGSFIPLLIYLLWQFVTLGVLPKAASSFIVNGNVSDFINYLDIATQNPFLGLFTKAFTFLAIATSFLGVAIGLFDSLAEFLNWPTADQNQRLKVSLGTFLPPLCFSLFYPNGFILALGYAAIALSILAILIPAAVALKWRSMPLKSDYQVVGGKYSLIVVFALGIILIGLEILNHL